MLLDETDGWRLDLDRVRAALRPSTRLIAVNFPNNPTGAIPDPDTWRGLVDLCEERGIRLVADEVYRGLELDPARRLTQAADMSPTAVSVNVLSKSYGLPGLRVGWVATRDRDLLRTLERHKHYTSICNAGPSEFLAASPSNSARRSTPATAASSPTTSPCSAPSSPPTRTSSTGPNPTAVVSRSPATSAPKARKRSAAPRRDRRRSAAARRHLRVRLAPVPSDRFRLGVGRRDAGPALDAIDHFLK